MIAASGITGGAVDTAFSNIERLTFYNFGSSYDDTIDASAWAPSADWTPTSGGGLPSLTIGSGTGDDTITGSAYGDVIIAGAGANVVDAAPGTDFVLVAADVAPVAAVRGHDGREHPGHDPGRNPGESHQQCRERQPLPRNTHGMDSRCVGPSPPALGAGHFRFRGPRHLHRRSGADTFLTAFSTPFLGQDTYTGNGGADLYSFIGGGASGLNTTTITDFDADDRIAQRQRRNRLAARSTAEAADKPLHRHGSVQRDRRRVSLCRRKWPHLLQYDSTRRPGRRRNS